MSDFSLMSFEYFCNLWKLSQAFHLFCFTEICEFVELQTIEQTQKILSKLPKFTFLIEFVASLQKFHSIKLEKAFMQFGFSVAFWFCF